MLDRKALPRATALATAAALLAGCGALPGEDDESEPIVVGTVSAPTALDPAVTWDGSWELLRNTFQTLLHSPHSGSAPEPDAAQACGFTDRASTVYRCTLRKGLTFSNGDPLDAADVKFSFDRIRKIASPTGPAPLLSNLARVETPNTRTVVFRLKKPDATFPYILATPATSIVDSSVYPADKPLRGEELSGSGPYLLTEYRSEKRAALVRNARYKGAARIHNEAVTIRYFGKPAVMAKELKSGRLDVIYRGLTPAQVRDFQQAPASKISLNEVTGTEIRYLVFNPDHPWAGKQAVRQAVAQLVDREALVRDAYDRTVEPLYSMVPAGITGHTNSFFNTYGGADVTKAERTLREAGIKEKVPLTLWYSTDHYGATTKAEFEELQQQLNASGLFDVRLQGRPWSEYLKGYRAGKYPVFGSGWFPDFPDADNFIGPFFGKENALGVPYEHERVTEKLLPSSRRESNRAVAARALTEAQDIVAKDARLVPLWQGKTYVASHDDISGVEWSVDASTIMRMWELKRQLSW